MRIIGLEERLKIFKGRGDVGHQGHEERDELYRKDDEGFVDVHDGGVGANFQAVDPFTSDGELRLNRAALLLRQRKRGKKFARAQ